jgi:hypothetical protein
MPNAPTIENKAPKDRSPSFPFIPLQVAIQRLEAFAEKFGRHPVPAGKVGAAWGMKEKSSQADQTIAALRSFGLVKYEGSGMGRHAIITDEGRNYLRTQQASVKAEILKVCALRPKIIRKFWAAWNADRPPNEVALDRLYAEKFSDQGASNFLKVYDDTIAFAGLSSSDKMPDDLDDGIEDEGSERETHELPLPEQKRVKLMTGERELTTGMLAKDASFRLIVSGEVGVKEIERLIKKLELDKEILAEQEAEPASQGSPAKVTKHLI